VKQPEKPVRGKRAEGLPKQTAASTGTRRVLSTDEQHATPEESTMRQPDERDQSADQQATPPRRVMKQAHDDLKSGQQDTDCRNRVAEALPDVPKTPRNFNAENKADVAPPSGKKK